MQWCGRVCYQHHGRCEISLKMDWRNQAFLDLKIQRFLPRLEALMMETVFLLDLSYDERLQDR